MQGETAKHPIHNEDTAQTCSQTNNVLAILHKIENQAQTAMQTNVTKNVVFISWDQVPKQNDTQILAINLFLSLWFVGQQNVGKK